MQQTSALYKELLAGDYTVETRVAIGESGLLVEKTGDHITFGGTRILVPMEDTGRICFQVWKHQEAYLMEMSRPAGTALVVK